MPLEDLKCPDCGGKMTSRVNRQTGQRFWGCNQFPKCKGTRDTDGDSPKDHLHDEEDDPGLPSERMSRNDRRRW